MVKAGNGVRKWKVRVREEKWVEYFVYSFYKPAGANYAEDLRLPISRVITVASCEFDPSLASKDHD